VAGNNVAAFRAIVDAVARKDEDALVARSHPEVRGETRRSAVQGLWEGHEGIRAYMRDNADTWERFEPSFADVEALPDGRVLAIGTIHVRSAASGVELDVPSAIVAEFRDGLMYRYKDYGDADAARAAVG